MASTTPDPEISAQGTLALLETRLHRLEFLLSGTSDDAGIPPPSTIPGSNNDTLRTQLDALENALAKLKRLSGTAGSVMRDVDRLSSTIPNLLSHASTATESKTTYELSTAASIVLAHAAMYPETASRLSSLQTLRVPPADQSTSLISLIPRLEQIRQEEDRMQNEVRELRDRSARCLEWWVKVGVVGMGDVCEDWEKRIRDVERNLIRQERQAKEEQGYL